MKSRCWMLLCLIFLGDLVRFSRADYGTDSDLAQLNTDNGVSGEGSVRLLKPIVMKEPAGYGAGLLIRKNKHLCPLGMAKIGIAKASGRRNIRRDDVPFNISGPIVRGKKCPCGKIRKKPRPDNFIRKQLVNSKETSFTHNRRNDALLNTTNSIERVTDATELPVTSHEISFLVTTTSATATTLSEKIFEEGTTNFDIQDSTTMPSDTEIKGVRRTKVDLPENLYLTNYTTDPTESPKINDSVSETTTASSTDVFTTVFESTKKWPTIPRITSLEARRNIVQVTTAPKKSHRKKKCKRKRKRIKTVVPLTTLKPIDSGHSHTTESSRPPTSGQFATTTVKPTLDNRENQKTRPTLSPTSGQAATTTVKPTPEKWEITTTRLNSVLITHQTTTVPHKPVVIIYQPPVHIPPVQKPPVQKPPVQKPPVQKPPFQKPPVQKPPVKKPPVQKPPVYRPPVQKPPVYRPPVQKPPVYQPPVYYPPVTKKPATKWIYYKYTPWRYPVYVAPTYRPLKALYNWSYKPSYGFGPIYSILKAKYNLLKKLG